MPLTDTAPPVPALSAARATISQSPTLAVTDAEVASVVLEVVLVAVVTLVIVSATAAGPYLQRRREAEQIVNFSVGLTQRRGTRGNQRVVAVNLHRVFPGHARL